MFEGLVERDKEEEPFNLMDNNSIINLILIIDIEEWREATKERNQIVWPNKCEKIKRIKDVILNMNSLMTAKE
jgi:hypothetical protein